jgi:hypothetical protein
VAFGEIRIRILASFTLEIKKKKKNLSFNIDFFFRNCKCVLILFYRLDLSKE